MILKSWRNDIIIKIKQKCFSPNVEIFKNVIKHYTIRLGVLVCPRGEEGVRERQKIE